jgi:stearoyl-CoA desaturase (delta-9 desaturase)
MTPPSPAEPKILWFNVAILTVLPIVAIVGVPWYVATHGLHWQEWTAALVFWWMTGLGITAGYHRLFAHKGWKAPWPVRLWFALNGAAAGQNSIIAWSAGHRFHHNEVDTDGDPYNAERGFFYSHMGWIMKEGPHEYDYSNVPDLQRDPICKVQHQHYLLFAVGWNLFLCVVAGLIFGNMLGMVLVAGVLRVVVVQHFTFLINSAAHTWGSQPWSGSNTAKDNGWLAFLTFGEGYHNFHHHFQMDYRNGTRWYHWDPTKWLIWSLSKLGLGSELRRTPVDVMLRARFERGRLDFSDRVDAWGQGKLDEWGAAVARTRDEILHRKDELIGRAQEQGAELRRRAEGVRATLQLQVLAAERAMEDALAELKACRERLTFRLKDLSSADRGERRAARGEIRALKAAVREAQAAAQRAFARWNGLLFEYRTRYAPALA